MFQNVFRAEHASVSQSYNNPSQIGAASWARAHAAAQTFRLASGSRREQATVSAHQPALYPVYFVVFLRVCARRVRARSDVRQGIIVIFSRVVCVCVCAVLCGICACACAEHVRCGEIYGTLKLISLCARKVSPRPPRCVRCADGLFRVGLGGFSGRTRTRATAKSLARVVSVQGCV